LATIASLSVSLTARIGSFEKGFLKAQKIAKRFASDVAGHITTIAKYGAAITGVALGALSYLVKGQLEAVDATSKLSRTLGLSTEELVGYQHAASLAGVDAEALSKAILKVNSTAEAGAASLSTSQRLLAIADQYKGISNAADRAAYLTKTFGRAGLSLGPFFEQGADGLRAASKEAERLGLSFSAIDGISIENANDAVTRLQSVITGVARRIAVQLAPFIEVVSNRLIAFAQNGNMAGSVVVNAINWMTRAFGKLADMFELLTALWNYFKAAVLGGMALILQGSNLVAKAIGGIADVLGIERLEGFADAFDSFADGFTDAAIDAAKAGNAALGKFVNGENAKKAQTFFEGLKVDAAKAADAAAGLNVPGVNDAASAASPKTSEFRQVDLSRVAIGGPSSTKDRPAGRDQIETSNNLLAQIAQNTRSRAVLV
jgi:hypothetical protein